MPFYETTSSSCSSERDASLPCSFLAATYSENHFLQTLFNQSQTGPKRAQKGQKEQRRAKKKAKKGHFTRQHHHVQVSVMLLCRAVFWPLVTGGPTLDIIF